MLLKVRIELRTNGGAPVRPAQTSQPNSQNAQQSGERRVFRRQMPEPIQNMSSYKEAQARAAQAQRQNANNGENNGNN